jgi:U3 small nucleolar RNA-associated protein 21
MKLDSVLFSFKQEGGAVTSISFRTDSSSEKFPFMVSGSPDGRLHIWNLGTNTSPSNMNEEDKLERRLERTIKDAHMGSVTRVHFLYGEPVMISAAADNTIKVWIFDAPDGSVRLLRSREGHSGCPLRIRYYGGGINVSIRDNAEATSCEIVSAGSDGTLRLFNTAIESQNREMSQNPILKKLGMHRRNARLPITTGFDFCETRQKDWGNLVSIHKNHTNAYLWRFKHRVVTEVILRQPSWQNNEMMYSSDRTTHSTAVSLSPCGNYAVVGSRGGVIYKYNVQSGANRGAYPIKFAELSMKKGTEHTRLNTVGNVLHEHKKIMNDDGKDYSAGSLKGGKKKKENAELKIINEGHTQEITGIFIDMMNSTMVSCGLDGLVIFWDFNNHNELNRIAHKSPQLFMQGFRDSGFIALAGQDRIIRLYDISTHKLSRRFDGHSREITDISFTPDGRRLLTSSVDCTVRVWDIITGRCLSWHLFPDAVLTMTVSPSGEYLCIAQADKEGIYMYVDRSLYETVHFWKEPTTPIPIADSLTLIEGNEENLDSNQYRIENEDNDDDVLVPVDIIPVQAQIESGIEKESPEQRGEGSITMSAVPKAYWTTLFNLEAIKRRNKAKAAPVAPKQAPFFLTTIVKGGATPSFPTPAEYNALLEKNSSSSLINSIGDSSDDPFPSKRNIDIDNNNINKKVKVNDDDVGEGDDEAKILAELASMGSAWGNNDDWDNDDKDIEIDINSRSANVSDEIIPDSTIENDIKTHVRTTNKSGSNSRIIGKNTKVSRCNLIMYLLEEYPDGLKSKKTQINDNNIDLSLMKYLKTLPPPAVDLEIRAICGYEGDDEGIMLLRCFISWLTENLKKGTNFEVLQAYIHRTVLIYSELFTKIPNISLELDLLKDVHRDISDRFRHLVQSNLCLLKMLAGLSST